MREACAPCDEVGDVVLGEVLTAAKSKDQMVVIFNLILGIQAILLQQAVVIQERSAGRNCRLAVDGVVNVQVADAKEIVAGGALVDVLVVVSEEHSLFPLAPCETSENRVSTVLKRFVFGVAKRYRETFVKLVPSKPAPTIVCPLKSMYW